MRAWSIYIAAVFSIALSCAVKADVLTGTSVTGSLTSNGSPNFYDPANDTATNTVPASYLNSAGPTVTISDTDIEFGALGGVDGDEVLITSDFTANGLVVSLQYTIPPGNVGEAGPSVFQFVDSVFPQFALSTTSDNFPNGGLVSSLSGDTLELDWSGVSIGTSPDEQTGTYTAVFALNTVPEPGSTTLVVVGLVALIAGGLLRRFRTKAVPAAER